MAVCQSGGLMLERGGDLSQPSLGGGLLGCGASFLRKSSFDDNTIIIAICAEIRGKRTISIREGNRRSHRHRQGHG